ncbi:MAG: ABC transporter ATP-binding protein, partial [Acidimicrobiia bacterium]|nr:ABC transporter ATP-binding protein [Acidimicrobiia bacterium]
LSGGQRQRVAVGRAIVRQPAAFLFDEPLSNLDAKLRVQMRSELGILHTRLQTTTLYVTHDQTEAMTMGDRVAVLKAISGKEIPNLMQVDTPRKLYDSPDNLFVAGFIGSPSMNFVSGTVVSENGSTYVAWSDTKLRVDRETLDSRPSLAGYAGQEIVVGVRPEAFELKAAMTTEFDPQRVMTIDVDLVEQLGSEAYVHFEQALPPVITPDIQELLADQGADASVLGDSTAFTARVNPDFAPRPGDKTDLVVETTKLHFFDKDSGEAIR